MKYLLTVLLLFAGCSEKQELSDQSPPLPPAKPSSVVQVSDTNQQETLIISDKSWPRWELDRWHSAYKTTGVIVSRCKPTIYIAGVAAGSPGEDAGLKTNDVVLMVGTNQASRMSLGEINRAMLGAPGKTIDLVVKRPGEAKTRKITVTVKDMTFETLKKRESNKAMDSDKK